MSPSPLMPSPGIPLPLPSPAAETEPALHRLTRIAGRLLQAPVAVLALGEGGQLSLQCVSGAPEELGSDRERLRKLCRELAEDEASPAGCREGFLGTRFALPSGTVLGVLAVADHPSRTWTDEEAELLQDLAASVVTELGLPPAHPGLLEAAPLRREHAELALWESEAQFRAIFDQAAIGIALVDRSGRVIETNPAFREWLGYAEPELVWMSFREFTHPEDLGEDGCLFQELLAGIRDAYRLEKRYLCRNGRVVWGRLTVSAVRDTAGVLQFAIRMVEDVTERRRAEARTEAFQSLGQLLNATTTPREAAGTVLEVADRLFGWDACWLELFDPDGDQAATILSMDVVEGKRTEVPPSYPEMVPSPLAQRAINEGPVLKLRTEQEVAALVRSHLEQELPFGDINRPSASILCVPFRNRDQVVGAISIQSYAYNAYSADDLATLQALADYCAGALQRTQAEAARRQLQEQWLQVQQQEAATLREAARLATIREEVGTALAADAELAGALREALQPLVKHLPVSVARVWTLDGTGRYLQLQASAGAYTEASGTHRLLRVGQTEIGRLISGCQPVLKEDVRTDPAREELTLPTGTVGFAGYPLLADGRAVGVLAVYSQAPFPLQLFETLAGVTERLARFVDRARSEQALQEVQARFSAFMDHTPAHAIMRDEESRFVYINRQVERTYGVTLESVRGQTPEALFDLETAAALRANDAETLRSGRPLEFNETIPLPDGTRRHYLAIRFPVRDAHGHLYVGGISQDITEWRALEEQLRQTQKLEAVGRLAGGVAHDFNNILAVINGYAALLLQRSELPATCRTPLEEVLKAGERAAALTRQLLAFSRKQIIQPQVLDLGDVVANIQSMLLRLIGEDIELVTLPGSGSVRIKADPGQVEQVLLNLVVNARDAMPRGGRMLLQVEAVHRDTHRTREGDEVPAGHYVRLSVTDTGCGMEPGALDHIFEPFYTTKPVGQGTGLGLATVYGIAKQNRGFVEVETALGRGSTFRVYFPEYEEPEAGLADASAPETTGGQETVLVVEDEAMLRRLVCDVLRTRGYEVLSAADGEEAARQCEGHAGPIHLLLTDVVMPGRSGREVAAWVTERHPALKTIYMSGYTDDAIVRHGVHAAEVQFLQKPFTPTELSRKVREVLDQG